MPLYVGPPIAGPGEPANPQLVPPLGDPVPNPPASGPQPPDSIQYLAPRATNAPILTGWGVACEYDEDSGLRSSPLAVAADAPPDVPRVAFWRVHGGYCRKVVTFVCEAIGGKPEVPSPDTGSANEVLMHRRVVPEVPRVNIDGKAIWRITGQYIYQLQCAPDPAAGDSYGTGRHPLSVLPAQLNTLNVADYVALLGPAAVAAFNGGPIDF